MQVKPRFAAFKVLEQYPIVKDSTGNEICLTLCEAKLHDSKYSAFHLDDCFYEVIHAPYQFWCVIGKNQVVWQNKAVSYESTAYWNVEKASDRKLFEGEINGFTIKEFYDGFHNLYNHPCLRTTFGIIKNG